MDLSKSPFSQVGLHCHPTDSERGCPGCGVLGGTVQDLLYIGLTIVVFAVLWLLLKGVERFER